MEKRLRLKDLSTISPAECIGEHIFWILVFFINYKNLLFVSLDGMSFIKSVLTLLACMIAASFVGIVIRWRKCMTTRGVIADVIIGIGIYSLLAYKEYYHSWIKILIVAFLVITGLYACFIFTRKNRGLFIYQLRGGRRKNFIIKNRVFKTLNMSGLFLGVCMMLFMIPITYNRIVCGGIMVADNAYTELKSFNDNYTNNEYSLTYNIDSISKIRSEETWKPLTTAEKLSVLQDVCNCEANYWGMNYRVSIVMDDLTDGALANYSDSMKQITISREHLENDECYEVLNSVLHEMYHSWEYVLVSCYLNADDSEKSLRLYRHCDKYIDEIQNYQDGGEDYASFMLYYSQYMEADSREYAKTAVREYYDEIDLILKEQAEENKAEGENEND